MAPFGVPERGSSRSRCHRDAVTDLLVRPTGTATATPPKADDSRSHSRLRSPILIGALAACAAAVAGLFAVEVVVAVLGLGDGRSTASMSDVLRVGAAVWL